ncbi:hypothetical protein BDB01DRAFT_769872 [Pilobolus umbonatus]|nr:hypothetical protein BDB01DRAFT_769872 [Pilobolus umbonatus]
MDSYHIMQQTPMQSMQQRPNIPHSMLPNGWVEYSTPTNQPYWFNTYTGQTTWIYPVAMTPDTPPVKKKQIKKKIPGTQWLFVLTPDGYEFYYDRVSKKSVWEQPEELKEAMEVLKKMEEEEEKKNEENKRKREEAERMNEEEEAKKQKIEEENKEKERQAIEDTTEMTEEDIMWQLQQMEEMGAEQMEEVEEVEEEQEEEEKEVKAVESKQPENGIELFYELLAEKKVSPFSTYSSEMPRLMDDPRFNMVPPHKQKTLFNKYCHDIGEKIRKEKAMKEKRPEEEFKELLESKVKEKMYWDDFRRKYKDDPRFKAIRVTKEKEALFKDHVKHLGKTRSSPVDDYMRLLRDTKEIRRGIRWRDAKQLLEKDPRYHAIDKEEREDLFRDYLDTL